MDVYALMFLAMIAAAFLGFLLGVSAEKARHEKRP